MRTDRNLTTKGTKSAKASLSGHALRFLRELRGFPAPLHLCARIPCPSGGHCRTPSSRSGPLLLTALLLTLAQGHCAEPNAQEARPAPIPQALADGYERTGRRAEATAIYEQLAATNSVARKVLAPRLVQIYAETGRTNEAMTWAQEVMRGNPDPQAYLAGVHSRLGQHKQAQDILEREIAANANATRAVTLRWQLADVHQKAGESAKARKALEEAAAAAKGTPMEAAAKRRNAGERNPK